MSFLEVLGRELLAVPRNIRDHVSYHARHALGARERYTHLQGRTTVYLLHGLAQSQAAMAPLARYLHGHGMNIVLYPHAFLGGDLVALENRLAADTQAHAETTGEKIDVVGHSLGALVGLKTAVQNPNIFRKVIGLGMPYHGTWTAGALLMLQSCRQIVPPASYIRTLKERGIPHNLEVYSICGEYDYALGSTAQAQIPNGDHSKKRNIRLEGYGHLSLLEEKVYALISDILSTRGAKLNIPKREAA